MFDQIMKPFVIVFCITLSVAACNTRSSEKTAESSTVVKPEINELPSVTLIDSINRPLSARSFGGNTILIFFSATCDHCQREATQIQQHLDSFRKYRLVFVAMDPFPVIEKFAKEYGIDGQPNIRFMRADGASVTASLGYIQTPTLLVYDSKRHLVKRFDGETPIDNVLAVL